MVHKCESQHPPQAGGQVHSLTKSEPDDTRTAGNGTMSRRESRVSINIRQNDALLEFENCKFMKPCWLNTRLTAPTQSRNDSCSLINTSQSISPNSLSLSNTSDLTLPPRLNSTLSVKIEELNAQISALNVENLRLRSTEIALSAQLRREKDKSRSIMADAEAAVRSPLLTHTHLLEPSPQLATEPQSNATQVMTLMSQFGSLRESHKVPAGKRAPKPSPVSTIRCRPQPNHPCPPLPRVARPPSFPEIAEEEEVEAEPMALSTRRRSSSRLPIPAKSTAPAVPVPVEEPQPKQKKKTSSRRQSGLIASGKPVEAPPSPPLELAVAQDSLLLVEDDGIFPVLNEQEEELGVELEVPKKKRKSRRKVKEEDNVLLVLEGTTSRLKDVTNSPQKTNSLPPLDTTGEYFYSDFMCAQAILTITVCKYRCRPPWLSRFGV